MAKCLRSTCNLLEKGSQRNRVVCIIGCTDMSSAADHWLLQSILHLSLHVYAQNAEIKAWNMNFLVTNSRIT